MTPPASDTNEGTALTEMLLTVVFGCRAGIPVGAWAVAMEAAALRAADPAWPGFVRRQYAAGCERIDELRKQVDADGYVPLPFRCYGCDASRTDFAVVTGDGVPMCVGCLGFVPGEYEVADAV